MLRLKKGNSLTTRKGALLIFALTSFAITSPALAVDTDQDSIDDSVDNCLTVKNPLQWDTDGDGIGNLCEPDGVGGTDSDGDLVGDATDNCPNTPNPRQFDTDRDGIGNVCEPGGGLPDSDSDGHADASDNCPDDGNPRQFNKDGDALGTVCDPDEQDTLGGPLDADTYARILFAEQGAMDAIARTIWAESQTMDGLARVYDAEMSAMGGVIRNRNLPGPVHNCIGCHAQEQPMEGGGTRRQIVGGAGDFGMTSHHVRDKDPTDIDCITCHYTGNHKAQTVQLADPDAGVDTIWDWTGDWAALEPWCLKCHDSDGAYSALGSKPFSSGVTAPDIVGSGGSEWSLSAHKTPAGQTCIGDGTTGCHVAAHSGVNDKLMVTAGNIEIVCSSCHTDYNLNGHATNVIKTIGADDFNVTCITCHNSHRIQFGATKLTTPDFSDPVNNNHAMGDTLTSTWVCIVCHNY